jgi:hypothetical protein
MLNVHCIHAGGFRRLVHSLIACGLMILLLESAMAQTMLNVTNYGANGDASVLSVNIISNSSVVTTATLLSSSDIGKSIEIFGGGPLGTTNIHQDLLAYITNVIDSTNLYLDRVAGSTSNGCYGVYGTNNAQAFQACIGAAPSNSIINIPDGTYLIIGASNFISFKATLFLAYPSIVISKGGLTLQGQSRANTILLGCGAWQNKGSYAYRGYMFECRGPVTNNGPLIFDTMTMDGGVQQGLTSYHYFPARTTDGDGWDVTHDAVVDSGLTGFKTKTFRNLTIRNWRGEQFKGVDTWTNGFISITNCSFSDGDATALNLPTSHNVDHCTFSNLDQIEEFSEDYVQSPSCFQNCLGTNIVGGNLVINGALSNSPNPTYTIRNNVFYHNGGVSTTPAQNLMITNNLFIATGAGSAINVGVSGYQGSAINSNIVVVGNTFSNFFTIISVLGTGNNLLDGLLVSNNIAYTSVGGASEFAGGYGWGTNMLFVDNYAYGFGHGLDSRTLPGQWYLDDFSNIFPTNKVNDTVGKTNVITYAFGGIRQQTFTTKPNSVFLIDDTHPAQIPPNAALAITHTGNYPALLYFSASMSGTPIVLTNGQTVKFRWMHGSWQIPSIVTSPSDLRVLPTVGS